MASVLYVVNTTSQDVIADGQIALGNVIRRSCNSQANLNNNAIVLDGAGYFVVDVNTTFTGTTGTAEIALYQDGVPVAGAVGSAAATTTPRSISFTCEVRNSCCKQLSSLTLVNTDAAITLTNVAVRVKRDA